MMKWVDGLARLLLAQIFVISGLGKLAGYAATQGYMQAMGVPGVLLPLVILLELGGGLALLAGWNTRLFGLFLAGFSVLSALLFHADFSVAGQQIHFMKNFAMAGGLLLLLRDAAAPLSLDAWLAARRR